MKRKKINIVIPDEIKMINKLFVKNCYELYIVGGAVRDSILGIEPKDWDLVTNATPDVCINLLKNSGFVSNILETGKQFGVINVFINGYEFELATMRKDISSGRKPTIQFSNMFDDVMRRGLTINALFFDIDTSEVVDLVGGIDDLNNKIVKAVGNPVDRFNEDKLRILRAVRFACRFDCDIESETFGAILDDPTPISGDGKVISNERIRDEFIKMVKTCKNFDRLITLMSLSLFEWVFGDLEINFEVLETKDPVLFIASLLRNNNPTLVEEVLKSKTFTKDEVKAIKFLLLMDDKFLEPIDIVKLKRMQKVSKLTTEQIDEFLSFVGFPFKEAFMEFKLTINGEDAIKAGIPKGPKMGEFILDEEVRVFKNLLKRF